MLQMKRLLRHKQAKDLLEAQDPVKKRVGKKAADAAEAPLSLAILTVSAHKIAVEGV